MVDRARHRSSRAQMRWVCALFASAWASSSLEELLDAAAELHAQDDFDGAAKSYQKVRSRRRQQLKQKHAFHQIKVQETMQRDIWKIGRLERFRFISSKDITDKCFRSRVAGNVVR